MYPPRRLLAERAGAAFLTWWSACWLVSELPKARWTSGRINCI